MDINMKEFLEEYKRLVNYKSVYDRDLKEEVRTSAVVPDKLVVPDIHATSGYILNNLPVVFEKIYAYLDTGAKQEILNLLNSIHKYSDNVHELATLYGHLARVLEWHSPTVESLEISHIFRFAKDVASFLGALCDGLYKLKGKIE
jgi:hypothetical protein